MRGLEKMTPQFFANQQESNHEMWATAMQWVAENRKLIGQIASQYRRYMAAENGDLVQEATIAAYKALLAVSKKEKPKQFVSFFRVIFKTNCIRLASGIQTEYCLEVHNLPVFDRKEEQEEFVDREAVKEALKTVSKRQREICIWLLEQPEPASTPELAREFNISRRHACRLISNSIKRIAGAS